jgi:hypothetical protein
LWLAEGDDHICIALLVIYVVFSLTTIDIEVMSNFFYPSPTLEGSTDVKTLRIARHCRCSRSPCDCKGLHPPPGQTVEIVLEIEDAEFSEEGTACECGHSWNSHGALSSLVDAEIERRAKVALRADELLEVCTLDVLATSTDYSLMGPRK